jgi:uncharacterized protein YjiS (DUF1127 family)
MSTLVSSYRGFATPAAAPTGTARSTSLLQRAIAWIAEQRSYRRTLNELSALSARELDDIGLSRSDLEAVARRSARLV